MGPGVVRQKGDGGIDGEQSRPGIRRRGDVLDLDRQVPELSVGGLFKVEFYGGIGRIMFDRQGPAPLSMPSNIAFGGVDPRTSESGNTFTIGANLIF